MGDIYGIFRRAVVEVEARGVSLGVSISICKKVFVHCASLYSSMYSCSRGYRPIRARHSLEFNSVHHKQLENFFISQRENHIDRLKKFHSCIAIIYSWASPMMKVDH